MRGRPSAAVQSTGAVRQAGGGLVNLMKFIHLTAQRNVPAIRRRGLRLGSDPIGRGVNCVPLMWVRLKSETEFSDGATRYIQCPRSSSSRIWQWFVRKGDTAAVVFEPKAHHWPAELIVHTDKPAARAIAAAVHKCNRAVRVVQMNDDFPDRSQEPMQLRIAAAGPRALGWLVRVFLTHDSQGFVDGRANTNFYVIFRTPIPARCITAIHSAVSKGAALKVLATRRADQDRDDFLESRRFR
ncbi:MAG: hypothetical protein IT435_19130 [Phycisphaerales bacterium]|nr:hypothetical protein [Phycisphaerales bacterium]